MRFVNGLYQTCQSPIRVSLVGLEPDRQGIIPGGTIFAVQDREGREAEAEDDTVHLIDLAECEFLCSMKEED